MYVFHTTPKSLEFSKRGLFNDVKSLESFVDTIILEEGSHANVLFYGYIRTTKNTLYVNKKSPNSFLLYRKSHYYCDLSFDDALYLAFTRLFVIAVKKRYESQVIHSYPIVNGILPKKDGYHYAVILSLVLDSSYFESVDALNTKELVEVHVDTLKPTNYITEVALSNFARVKE